MEQSSSNVGVLGLGNWGTALAQHLASAGCTVCAWTISREIADSVNNKGKNPDFLSDIKLSNNLSATLDINKAVKSEYVIVAVPSAVLNVVAAPLKNAAKESIIVSGVKGLESATMLTPLAYFEAQGIPAAKLAVLSGPSFARDVSLKKPCGVVAASKNFAVAEKVAALFSNSSMRVYASDDPIGVELGGIVKNVIALAAGISDGLELGDSARAGLVTRGLAEMMRFITALGGKEQTVFGLSGLGDLAMTASSALSRNRTVGYRLGKGEKLNYIVESLGSVAEAVAVTPYVLALAKKHNIEMPISAGVAAVLSGKVSAREAAQSLIERPMKREF
jgi:glycerol-3-phosphate dehydrogenase (NAD(P)+)